MPENIAWSLTAGGEGAGLATSGALAAGAVTSASAVVDPGAAADLNLQLGDIQRVQLFALTSSRYDGSVSVKGPDQNDVEIALTGPILAFGAVAGRVASSLAKLTIKVAAPQAGQPQPAAAAVRLLVATNLA